MASPLLSRFTKLLLLVLVTGSCFGQMPVQKKLSTPEKDFETFWTTFRDNYAFFRLKGVNWDSAYRHYRPLVQKKTTQAELITILGKMVDPLKDGHITIAKGDEFVYKGKKTSYFKEEFKGLESDFWQAAWQTLEKEQFTPIKGVGPVLKGIPLYYVSQNGQVGYIRITRCFGTLESLFDDAQEQADTQRMLSLFDSLLTTLSTTKALILDVRSNGGGHAGELLARRFTAEKRLTHYKAIRQKGDYETTTPLEPQYLEPDTSHTPYLKPIALLTNDKTASSAEDLAIALSALPHVTTLGDHTAGMLSDMMEGKLSGNLFFTLSNQRYYTTAKTLLEDVGIMPDKPVAHTRNDVLQHTDPVLKQALQVLHSPISD